MFQKRLQRSVLNQFWCMAIGSVKLAGIDINFGISSNIGLRLNAMSEKLVITEIITTVIAPGLILLLVELSDRFNLDVRYEYVNNERFIDREFHWFRWQTSRRIERLCVCGREIK